jgi:hypothetical protein
MTRRIDLIAASAYVPILLRNSSSSASGSSTWTWHSRNCGADQSLSRLPRHSDSELPDQSASILFTISTSPAINNEMSFNLDRKRIYIRCPRCNFFARPFLRQVRHRETIICSGCKANIRLDDWLGSYRKAERQVRQALNALKAQLGSMTLNLKL